MSEKLVHALVAFLQLTSYPGVFLLMAIQSACIPIPSEIIMPFAGYALVSNKAHPQLQLLFLAFLGSIGANVGSIPAYWLGAKGGRPLIVRYGRYILMSAHDLDRAERFFARFGSIAVLIGRLLPVVRTFIALPAGIAKMNQVRFHIYTFIGSFPWCYALAWIGLRLGAEWDTNPVFKAGFHRFQVVVEVAIVVAFVYFVYSHWKNRVRTTEA
jgi:membrane protein DedA with SNARE-associated domain